MFVRSKTIINISRDRAAVTAYPKNIRRSNRTIEAIVNSRTDSGDIIGRSVIVHGDFP